MDGAVNMATEAKDKQKNQISLLFIVSGTPAPLDVNVHQTLKDVFQRAIHKAGIAGDQNPDEWDFTYDKVVLDQSKAISEFGLPENAQIYLNKKVGGAG